MNKLVGILLLSFACVYSVNAIAKQPQDQTFDWDLSLNLGLTAGGDKMYEAFYTDGTTADVRGGGLYYGTVGLDFPIVDQFHIVTNVGYHFDSENGFGTKDGMSFGRWTFEAIPYMQFAESWKAGAGLVYHGSPKFEGRFSDGSELHAGYKNSLGATAFIGYQIPKSQSWLELRYTFMEYKIESINGIETDYNPKYSGSHVGFIFHWAIL